MWLLRWSWGRIRVPAEGNGLFDQEQLPPAAAPRPRAAEEQQPLRNPLGTHTAPPATPVTNRRAKVPRSPWGLQMQLEGLKVPEVTKCALALALRSAGLSACESRTRRFATTSVPLAHDKQLLRQYPALPHSRGRTRYLRGAGISVS